jgi:putative FmdB family regulatory protein
MPIYEYECDGCGSHFEKLVRGDAVAPACPQCQSTAVRRLHSLFGVSSEGTRQAHLQAARQANKKVQRDKAIAEHEAIHHMHSDEH